MLNVALAVAVGLLFAATVHGYRRTPRSRAVGGLSYVKALVGLVCLMILLIRQLV